MFFEYNTLPERVNDPLINNTGFGHIAFHVTDVEETLKPEIVFYTVTRQNRSIVREQISKSSI